MIHSFSILSFIARLQEENDESREVTVPPSPRHVHAHNKPSTSLPPHTPTDDSGGAHVVTWMGIWRDPRPSTPSVAITYIRYTSMHRSLSMIVRAVMMSSGIIIDTPPRWYVDDVVKCIGKGSYIYACYKYVFWGLSTMVGIGC